MCGGGWWWCWYEVQCGQCVDDVDWYVDEKDLVLGGGFDELVVQCWFDQWVDEVRDGDEVYCLQEVFVWEGVQYDQLFYWQQQCVVCVLYDVCGDQQF